MKKIQKRKNKSSQVNNQVFAWKITSQFIHWMLRSRSLTFLSFCVITYTLITFIFALIIMVAAKVEPRCVTSPIFDRSGYTFSAGLNDAWQLSWTTFSTVGYGYISPSTSASFLENIEEFRDGGSCALMSFVLSFECLLGILAVSFAGAIIYGKLIQFQCVAKIKFSEVMVVKFGQGLKIPGDSVSSTCSAAESKNSRNATPCPVLIFRIVNLLHENKFGDVVAANVHSVATVKKENSLAQQENGNTQFRNAFQSRRDLMDGSMTMKLSQQIPFNRNKFVQSQKKNPIEPQKKVQGRPKLNTPGQHHVVFKSSRQQDRPKSSKSSTSGQGSLVHKLQHILASKAHNSSATGSSPRSVDGAETIVDSVEGRSSATRSSLRSTTSANNTIITPPHVDQEKEIEMPNLVFEKITLSPNNHPCFNASWRVIHTLDEKSPLLNKEVRNKIKKAGGFWPADLNNVEGLEKSIDFDQFLVSFDGLSKATGSNVYAHKVYKMDNLNIGYQFESILEQKPNGTIGVRADDIDKIKEQ